MVLDSMHVMQAAQVPSDIMEWYQCCVTFKEVVLASMRTQALGYSSHLHSSTWLLQSPALKHLATPVTCTSTSHHLQVGPCPLAPFPSPPTFKLDEPGSCSSST
jgi:hypothetical protein